MVTFSASRCRGCLFGGVSLPVVFVEDIIGGSARFPCEIRVSSGASPPPLPRTCSDARRRPEGTVTVSLLGVCRGRVVRVCVGAFVVPVALFHVFKVFIPNDC